MRKTKKKKKEIQVFWENTNIYLSYTHFLKTARWYHCWRIHWPNCRPVRLTQPFYNCEPLCGIWIDVLIIYKKNIESQPYLWFSWTTSIHKDKAHPRDCIFSSIFIRSLSVYLVQLLTLISIRQNIALIIHLIQPSAEGRNINDQSVREWCLKGSQALCVFRLASFLEEKREEKREKERRKKKGSKEGGSKKETEMFWEKAKIAQFGHKPHHFSNVLHWLHHTFWSFAWHLKAIILTSSPNFSFYRWGNGNPRTVAFTCLRLHRWLSAKQK